MRLPFSFIAKLWHRFVYFPLFIIIMTYSEIAIIQKGYSNHSVTSMQDIFGNISLRMPKNVHNHIYHSGQMFTILASNHKVSVVRYVLSKNNVQNAMGHQAGSIWRMFGRGQVVQPHHGTKIDTHRIYRYIYTRFVACFVVLYYQRLWFHVMILPKFFKFAL